jgi:hypothetical protein
MLSIFFNKKPKTNDVLFAYKDKIKKNSDVGLGFQAQLPLGFCIKAKNVGLVNKRLTIFGPLIFC